jgi:hypothetical protein
MQVKDFHPLQRNWGSEGHGDRGASEPDPDSVGVTAALLGGGAGRSAAWLVGSWECNRDWRRASIAVGSDLNTSDRGARLEPG